MVAPIDAIDDPQKRKRPDVRRRRVVTEEVGADEKGMLSVPSLEPWVDVVMCDLRLDARYQEQQ